MTPATLARAQGGNYAITSVWPLVHMRSFEAVTGPSRITGWCTPWRDFWW